MKLIPLNEYLYESNQNLVHYLSCQAGCYTYSVLRILISAPAICIKTLASRVQALAFRVDALLLALSFSFFLLLSYFNLDAHLHVVFLITDRFLSQSQRIKAFSTVNSRLQTAYIKVRFRQFSV